MDYKVDGVISTGRQRKLGQI